MNWTPTKTFISTHCVDHWIAPQLLYEDNHIVVGYKPFNMPSQDDVSGHMSLFRWIRLYYQRVKNVAVRLHLIHRLDRPVAGLMVFAKHAKGAHHLGVQFRERRVKKAYVAVCHGIAQAQQAKLVHYLKKDRKNNVARLYNSPGKSRKEAILFYRTLQTQENKSLLLVYPYTGRPHQIRVQLAKVKLPIVGDMKYGKGDQLLYRGIALMGYALLFRHPIYKHNYFFLLEGLPNDYPWSYFEQFPSAQMITDFWTQAP